MTLQEHLEFLSYEIAFWAVGLDDPNYPIDQFGSLSETVSYQLRSLAIITLLTEGDTNLFYHNLIRSGLVRETFLKRCQHEKYQDFYCAISRSGAFFDTLAAGNFDLARRIDTVSHQKWFSKGEYEDDYCFTKFFHLMIQKNTDRDELVALVDRFEKSLEGATNPKLDVCHAFMANDQKILEEAFHDLIEAHDSYLAQEKERGQMEDPHIVAQRSIYVEGLAIIRIAERHGLKLQTEFKFCPQLAMMPMTVPPPKKFP